MESPQHRGVVPLHDLGLLEVASQRWPDEDSPYVLQLFYADTPKGRECVGLFLGSFETAPGRGLWPLEEAQPVAEEMTKLTSALLRSVSIQQRAQEETRRAGAIRSWELSDAQLDRAIARFRAKYPAQKSPPTITAVLAEMDPADVEDILRQRAEVRTVRRRGKGGRPPLAADHYEEIASLYDDAVRSGDKKPAKSIAARYGKSIRTARNWIWEARRRGLLPATGRGRVQPNPEEPK